MTAKLTEDLCELLRKGHYVQSACAFIGIHRASYYNWHERGNAARVLRDQGKPVPRRELLYLKFVDDTELARDHGEAWLVEELLRHAADPKSRGQWQAYMTMLERSRPDRWRRRSAAEYMDKPRAPEMFTFDPTKLSADKLEQLRVLLEEAQPDPAT